MKPNRFVVEVKNGTFLFLNIAASVPDGWWWGVDDSCLQHGPFASSEEAVADIRRDRDFARFKLVRWDDTTLAREPDDRSVPPRGHIVVVDTGGHLCVKTGEPPAPGWKPRQQ